MVDVDARLAQIAANAEGTLSDLEGVPDNRLPLDGVLAKDALWLLAVLKEQAGQIERLQREATADAVARSGGGQ